MKKISSILLSLLLAAALGAPVFAASLVDGQGVVQEAALKTAITKKLAASGGGTTVTIKSAASVSPAALRAANTAGGGAVVLRFDTMTAGGANSQGRMYLQPSRLTKRKTAIRVGVYTDSASVSKIKSAMAERYSNRMAYIHMEHSGTLTVPTKIMARVKLTGLNTGNLRFYLYDSGKDTLKRIESPDYSVSKSYVTFYTGRAGDIVITDSELVTAGADTAVTVNRAADPIPGAQGSGGASAGLAIGAEKLLNADPNELAEKVFQLTNQERIRAGVPALQWDDDLQDCAMLRAEELAEKFSHERPDGTRFSSVIRDRGLPFGPLAENIYSGPETPEAAVKGWMNSSGHKKNMLNGDYDAGGHAYWVQLFGGYS